MECLITGIKGFGKTAHALDLVFFQDSEFKGMDVYVEGISFTDEGHNAMPHFNFPSLAEIKNPDFVPLCTVDNEDEEADKYKPWVKTNIDYPDFLEARATAKHPIELWFLWVQKNSVIFIDEAQRFYRPRPAGSKIPLHIRMVEVARHYGMHFVFVSQAPRLIDINLRTHIEKHIHLDKTWKGGLKFEAIGCMDIDSKQDRKDAVKSSYTPPAHLWTPVKLYHSSSLHLKVKHKIPKMVFMAVAAIPLLVFIIYMIVLQVKKNHIDKNPVAAVSGSLPGALVAGAKSGVLATDTSEEKKDNKIEKYIEEFKPLIPGRPETAPAYNGLRKVVVMPVISACLKSATACLCYSQQGTRLTEVPPERCEQILETGQGFDPYTLPVARESRPVVVAAVPE